MQNVNNDVKALQIRPKFNDDMLKKLLVAYYIIACRIRVARISILMPHK